MVSKHGCLPGTYWNSSIQLCKKKCSDTKKRSKSPPYKCVTKNSCPKSKKGKKRVFIKSADKCMVACSKDKRRMSKSPYKCRSPCKPGKRRSPKTGKCQKIKSKSK